MRLSTPAGTVELRPASPADRPLLEEVYASTRADELAAVGWTDEQQQAFTRMQFEAQDRHYREYFPEASYDVVELDGVPVGRIYVDRRADELRVLDLALLPSVRGLGIGTRLLQAVLDEADRAGVVVRFHVEVHNRARRLYERLGFVPAGDTGAYVLLERPCATSPP